MNMQYEKIHDTAHSIVSHLLGVPFRGRRAPMRALIIVALPALTATALAAEATATKPDEPVKLTPLVVNARKEQAAPVGGGLAALATVTTLEPSSERLSDLFQRVPGLITQDSFGGFDPPRLAVRGSAIQSAPTSRGLTVTLFGMPLNAADGSLNLALLESSWLESAALIRGPAAGVPALGGSLTLGGAGEAFAPGFSVGTMYGSDDTFTLTGRGASVTGDSAVAGRAAVTHSAGWRPHAEQQRESVYAATRTALGDDWDLTVQLFASRPWYEVPGPLTKSAALNAPTAPVAAVLRDDPRRATEYAQLAARASKRWHDAQVSLALGGVHCHDEFYQLQANGVSVTESMEAYLAFNAEQDWDRAGQHTAFTALLQTGWWDARRYRNASGHQGALIGTQHLQPLTLTTAVDHRVKLADDHQLELGISSLTANRDIDDELSPAPGQPAVDLGFSGTRYAPRAAWEWSPLADTTFVLAWARSYEPPTYNDLLFTDGPAGARILRSAPLDWQRADSFELGARGRYQQFAWSSCIYHARWHGEFLRLLNPDGSSRGTVNAGRTIHNGWESNIEWEMLPAAPIGLTFWATYNYTTARFDGDPVFGDRRLAGVSPHNGALGLRATSAGGWFIVPACLWRAGETYGDHAHNISYGGSCLWSLELGRRHPAGWSASIGIHNIFNSKTIASTAGVLDRSSAPQNTAIFLPAAGRTAGVRLEYTW
jgi:iron complex outermembrane receptor protein